VAIRVMHDCWLHTNAHRPDRLVHSGSSEKAHALNRPERAWLSELARSLKSQREYLEKNNMRFSFAQNMVVAAVLIVGVTDACAAQKPLTAAMR
jgi:hypothetical protein